MDTQSLHLTLRSIETNPILVEFEKEKTTMLKSVPLTELRKNNSLGLNVSLTELSVVNEPKHGLYKTYKTLLIITDLITDQQKLSL